MSAINTTDALAIERYVWFTNTVPASATSTHAGEILENTFYNKAGAAALVTPGEYLVIGPRDETVVSSKPENPAPTSDDLTMTEDGEQVIDITAGLGMHVDLAGADIYPYIKPLGLSTPSHDDSRIKTPTSLVTVMDATGYPNDVVGLNVSEPLANNKYPVPSAWVDHDGDGLADAYGSGTLASTYRDSPVDSVAGMPLQVDDILDTQTVENYKTAFLQRLANPLLRWNPEPGQPGHDTSLKVNPYITVDWIPIDLTVYNGEDQEPAGWDSNLQVGDPAGPIGDFDPDDNNPTTPKFASRHKRAVPFSPPNFFLETGIIWTNNTEVANRPRGANDRR